MTRHLTDFFKLIRWKNVLIYWFTIGLLYKFYILNNNPNLIYIKTSDNKVFFLLVLFFSLLGIAGNLQNNYFDYNLDRLKKNFINFNKKYIRLAYSILYSFAIIIFFIIISYFSVNNFSTNTFAYLLPISILLMIAYNIFFKKIAFIGNLIVALLTSLSVTLPIFVIKQTNKPQLFTFLFIMITITTLLRELVKDMEDKEFDKTFNYRTLPIVNRSLSYVFISIYFLLFIFVLFYYKIEFKKHFFTGFFVLIILIFSLTAIEIYRKKYEIGTRLIKLLMLAGIIFYIYGIKNFG